jgi:26S proteasome regulatory subunit N7
MAVITTSSLLHLVSRFRHPFLILNGDNLATLEQTLFLPSRLLSPHTRYYVREMRILAYSQLLESYWSLTGQSKQSVQHERGFRRQVIYYLSLRQRSQSLPSELSRFIANGRLHCSIDKVHGIVETTRPSLKNAQYETVIGQGDVLLNSVQRLSKVLY